MSKETADKWDDEELPHDSELARSIWEEARRVIGLHYELAHLYRTKSTDWRTIKLLWEKIEEGEYGLRMVGVQL